MPQYGRNGGKLRSVAGGSYGVKREKFGLTFSGNTNVEREKSIIDVTRTSLVAGELFQRTSANNIHPGWFGDLSMEDAFNTLNRVNLSISSWGGAWPTIEETLT